MKNKTPPKPVWLSQVEDAPAPDWLWQGRIPKGHLTILEGPPGQGKTMLLLDIASRLSRAKPLPDVPPEKCSARMQRTLILTGEDDLGTLRARVLAAGGDCSSIGVVEEILSFPGDASALENVVHDYGVDMLIIDPINSYLSEKINGHNDQETRRALQPLRDIARREGVAVVLVRHLTKNTTGPAVNRGMGSIAFSALARSQLQLVQHDQGFALARAKGNLGKPPMALPFTIEGDEDSPRILWGEPFPGTADALLNGTTETGSPSDRRCAEFIIERLKQSGGNVLSAILEKEGASYGFNIPVLKRAKAILKNEGKAYSKKVGESWFVVMNQEIKSSIPRAPELLNS